MWSSACKEMAVHDPDSARAVLAAALSVSRCNEASQTGCWKQRALVARSTLHRLSSSLRKLAEQNGSQPNIAAQLLQQLEPGAWDWKRDDAEQAAAAACTVQALERRASHLQHFIEAVEVRRWPNRSRSWSMYSCRRSCIKRACSI